MGEPSPVLQLHPSTQPPPDHGSNQPVHTTFASAANLANLLPTGTVLAFQALRPSFSNYGTCQLSNQFLTATLLAFCTITCFLSSFIDTFMGFDGKLYYGVATFNGLYIFNDDSYKKEESESNKRDLSMYRISVLDFVHSFLSLLVFLIFALSNSEVQGCFFAEAEGNKKVLMMRMPLGAGVLATFLFTIFPTTRRGIGYATAMAAQS